VLDFHKIIAHVNHWHWLEISVDDFGIYIELFALYVPRTRVPLAIESFDGTIEVDRLSSVF
jgi:hypothetical protein